MTTVEYDINTMVIHKIKLILGFIYTKFKFLNETLYIVQFDNEKELMFSEDIEPYYNKSLTLC